MLPLRAAHRAALARDARHHPHQSVGLRAHDLERGRGDAQAHPQADDSAIHECVIYARTSLSIASAAGALTTGCVCAWRAVSWLEATGRGRGARAVAALAGSHQLPLKSRARVRTFSYDYNLRGAVRIVHRLSAHSEEHRSHNAQKLQGQVYRALERDLEGECKRAPQELFTPRPNFEVLTTARLARRTEPTCSESKSWHLINQHTSRLLGNANMQRSRTCN